MTIVGLVSDTHLPRFGRALPRALDAGLRAAGVARILHLGDMTDPIAIDLFEAIAPFDAVAGNNDPESSPSKTCTSAWCTVTPVARGPRTRTPSPRSRTSWSTSFFTATATGRSSTGAGRRWSRTPVRRPTSA
jgi:hypothetical protein